MRGELREKGVGTEIEGMGIEREGELGEKGVETESEGDGAESEGNGNWHL